VGLLRRQRRKVNDLVRLGWTIRYLLAVVSACNEAMARRD
jgi:hypothetical protein